MIKYYDHMSGTRLSVSKTIKDLSECTIEEYIDPDTAASKLQNEDFVIVHIKTTPFIKLLNNSKRDSVRLRVSSEGFERDKSYQTKDGVNCLFLRPPHNRNLSADDWQTIFQAITDPHIVSQIVAETESIPPYLQKYFGGVVEGGIIALAILCRGYLYAWANSNRLELNNIKNDVDLANKILTIMHNISVTKNSVAKFKVPDLVSHPKWWKIFDDPIGSVAVREQNKFEIDPNDFEYVTNLANRIDSAQEDSGKTIDEPVLIANAFLEIKKQEARFSW